MDEWPAYKQGSSRKWTFEFFKSEYGNEPCTVDTAGSKVDTTLGEYISKLHEYGRAALAKQQVPYLRTWYFSDDIPALVDDFEPPAHLHSTDAFLRLPEDLRPPFRWLFFGPAGTESKVHVDVWETDAWLGMLEGHKTFTLFHPAHRKYIEASHNEFPDLLRPPNAARFPQQSLAVPAQVLLGPGEILYIPRKWPHHAVAQTASISLTLNFAPAAAKAAVMEKVIPYARNRGRCQMLLGRTLRARDNLMQLCIHGGQIKYGDFKDAVKARNPMAGPGSDSDSGDEDDSSLASAEGE
jgi:histone arginine demethylase JMJD6